MARLLLALALPVAVLGIYPDDHWKYSTKLTVGNFDGSVRLLRWHLRRMMNPVCLADQECRGRRQDDFRALDCVCRMRLMTKAGPSLEQRREDVREQQRRVVWRHQSIRY